MTSIPTDAPTVKIGDWLREGWEVFAADVGMFILAGLVYNVLNGICFPILFGPLTCGMFLMIFDRMDGGKADIKRLFAGFDFFGTSFVAGLIFLVLAFVGVVVFCIGFMLCVLPSLIGLALLVLLQTAFLFTFQLIVRQGLGATEAIAVSYNKIRENLWQFLLFGLVLYLISMAGYSVMLGCLVTTPLVFAAQAAAYRDIFGLGDTEESPPPASTE
jgi:uncharacterized membrane protein